MKKAGVFLLILLCVLTCVVTTMGEFLYSAFFGDTAQASGTQYALSMDENGIVYYVENLDGVNHIVKVDDLGNIIVDEELPVMTDAGRFVVQDIYVTSDNYIYVAGFEADLITRTATRALLVALDENGALYATPYDRPIAQTSLRQPRNSALFAAMSEDDERVYFAFLNEGQAAVLAHEKSSDGAVESLDYVNVDQNVTAMYVTPEGRLIFAAQDGQLRISAQEGSGTESLGVPSVYSFHFYRGSGNTFYFHDASTGGVGQVNYGQGTLSTIVAGAMDIGDGRCFSDFSQVAVGARGKLAGMLYSNQGYTVYTGSESRMTASPAARRSAFDNDKLIAVAVLVGAVLLTVLLWDVYCNLLKMRVSVLLRQALLISMSLVILVYVLLELILLPQMRDTLTEQYEHQVSTAARVLAANVESLDEEARDQALRSAQVSVMASDSASVPVYFSLVRVGESNVLEATNESDVSGVTYNAVPFSADLGEAIGRALTEGEVILEFHDAMGQSMYALTRAGEDLVVIAGMNADNVGSSLEQFAGRIRLFLVGVCGALFVALLLVEGLTVRSISRLRRGVDAVSAGNYDVTIDVSSGDEVENLAHAVTAMARKIRGNTQKLTDLSASYYRFVPENLVQLLGETSIEKVGKSSYVEKDMTVLIMRFTFSDEEIQKSTGELFRNINNVIEHISPLVTDNGGTVYDFEANGFIAVFARNEDALRAALRIRQAAVALDKSRREQGMCQADVRLVLSGGDVMLGIVGDENRMAPAVVSDVVATSERLSALQVPSSIYILCTADVVEGAQGYRMRRIGQYFDRGRALELYDVYDGDPYALLKLKESIQPQFEAALACYEQGDMAQARLRFMQIVKTAFDDGVSRNYLYCADARLNGRGEAGYRVM